MNQFNHDAFKNVLDLMTQSHTGLQGGGYGSLRDAAEVAVNEFGVDWIAPQASDLVNKMLHESLTNLVKLTCPKKANMYRTKQKFFEYAKERAHTISLTKNNPPVGKCIPSDLLSQLE